MLAMFTFRTKNKKNSRDSFFQILTRKQGAVRSLVNSELRYRWKSKIDWCFLWGIRL